MDIDVVRQAPLNTLHEPIPEHSASDGHRNNRTTRRPRARKKLRTPFAPPQAYSEIAGGSNSTRQFLRQFCRRSPQSG